MSYMIPASVLDAERSIVGSALVWPEVLDIVDLDAGTFAHPGWGLVWGVILELRAAGSLVDPVTVEAVLEARGKAKAVSLAEAAANAVSPHSALQYAEVISSHRITVRVMEAVGEVMKGRGDGLGGEDLLSFALERISSIEVSRSGAGRKIGEIVTKRFGELAEIADAKMAGQEMATGLLTRIPALDRLLGGIQRGIVTTAAARPGMGKSALSQTIADNLTRSGVGVHVFSLEDTESSYADRSLSRNSNVGAERIRTVDFQRGDLEKIKHATMNLRGRTGWLVEDTAAINAHDVVRRYRRSKAENETQLVIVDYIQLLRGRQGQWDRTEILEEAMTAFSDAAKLDNVAFLVLSQLNRKCEERPDKRPILSDLRQSGAIEERSKCVMFLYRDNVYNEHAPNNEIELLVRKNNHGKTGFLTAGWDGDTTRIF